MKDTFENRVRSAAVAGWWTLLIAAIVFSLVWIVYLILLTVQPAWVLALIGSNVTWPMLENISIWFFAVLKLCLWLWLFALVWLTLWARELRKHV